MTQSLGSFVEVCIYKIKPDKVEESEGLIGRVVDYHRRFPGVRDVR